MTDPTVLAPVDADLEEAQRSGNVPAMLAFQERPYEQIVPLERPFAINVGSSAVPEILPMSCHRPTILTPAGGFRPV